MTSRRAFKHHEQKLARVLQFEPGHVGGRVASAQPVNRLGGTVRGSVVGAAGPIGVVVPGGFGGIVTAVTTVTGSPTTRHPLAGTLAAVTTTAGTLTVSGVLQWSEYPAGYTWANHPAGVTWADLDEPGAP